MVLQMPHFEAQIGRREREGKWEEGGNGDTVRGGQGGQWVYIGISFHSVLFLVFGSLSVGRVGGRVKG